MAAEALSRKPSSHSLRYIRIGYGRYLQEQLLPNQEEKQLMHYGGVGVSPG